MDKESIMTWIDRLAACIANLLGISVDLANLGLTYEDLFTDLEYGRT